MTINKICVNKICEVPRCRKSADMTYYAKNTCNDHWIDYCRGHINLKKVFGVIDIKRKEAQEA